MKTYLRYLVPSFSNLSLSDNDLFDQIRSLVDSNKFDSKEITAIRSRLKNISEASPENSALFYFFSYLSGTAIEVKSDIAESNDEMYVINKFNQLYNKKDVTDNEITKFLEDILNRNLREYFDYAAVALYDKLNIKPKQGIESSKGFSFETRHVDLGYAPIPVPPPTITENANPALLNSERPNLNLAENADFVPLNSELPNDPWDLLQQILEMEMDSEDDSESPDEAEEPASIPFYNSAYVSNSYGLRSFELEAKVVAENFENALQPDLEGLYTLDLKILLSGKNTDVSIQTVVEDWFLLATQKKSCCLNIGLRVDESGSPEKNDDGAVVGGILSYSIQSEATLPSPRLIVHDLNTSNSPLELKVSLILSKADRDWLERNKIDVFERGLVHLGLEYNTTYSPPQRLAPDKLN